MFTNSIYKTIKIQLCSFNRKSNLILDKTKITYTFLSIPIHRQFGLFACIQLSDTPSKHIPEIYEAPRVRWNIAHYDSQPPLNCNSQPPAQCLLWLVETILMLTHCSCFCMRLIQNAWHHRRIPRIHSQWCNLSVLFVARHTHLHTFKLTKDEPSDNLSVTINQQSYA